MTFRRLKISNNTRSANKELLLQCSKTTSSLTKTLLIFKVLGLSDCVRWTTWKPDTYRKMKRAEISGSKTYFVSDKNNIRQAYYQQEQTLYELMKQSKEDMFAHWKSTGLWNIHKKTLKAVNDGAGRTSAVIKFNDVSLACVLPHVKQSVEAKPLPVILPLMSSKKNFWNSSISFAVW